VEADSLGLRMYVGGHDSSVKPIKVYLCVRVRYHISTDTLAIETAAFLTLHLLLSATFHVYFCFPQNVNVNFSSPPNF